MKAVTRNAHAARIDAVLSCVQAALDQGNDAPGLDTLAGVAHLSSFHFHRVWRALTGESIGRTIARLRLLRALHLLEVPSASVTDVALASGYDSSQSLARAVRDALGTTPGELRGQAERLAEARQRLQLPESARASAPLHVDVVSLEPFEVVALRNRGAFDDLDAAFGLLFEWAADAGLVTSVLSLHGVPLADHRDVAADALEFECAIRLDATANPPPPMRPLALAGGLHARARHVGAYEGIEAVVDRVLADWLPASGYALRDEAIHYVFLDDPETVPEALLRADVYVPLAGGAAAE